MTRATQEERVAVVKRDLTKGALGLEKWLSELSRIRKHGKVQVAKDLSINVGRDCTHINARTVLFVKSTSITIPCAKILAYEFDVHVCAFTHQMSSMPTR